MLITAVCPQCGTKYQVQENLRGKPMRCLTPTCRHVFVIDPPPAAAPRQAGTVGDLIPLLSAEPLAPQELPALEPISPEEPAGPGASWRHAPPPRRGELPPVANGLLPPVGNAPGSPGTPVAHAPGSPAADESRPRQPLPPRSAVPPKAAASIPRVLGPGAWDAPPPVRRGPADTVRMPASARPTTPEHVPAEPAEQPPGHAPAADPVHRPRGRWARWVVWPLVGLTVLVLAGGGVGLYLALAQNEESLAEKADKQYAVGLYRDAAGLYQTLAEKYPGSDRAGYYRFRHELADIRYLAKEPETPLPALDRMDRFLTDHAKDPLLPAHGPEIGEALVNLLTGYAATAESTADEKPLEVMRRGTAVVAAARKIKLPRGAAAVDWAKVEAAFGRVREAVARVRRKNRVLARLRELAAGASYQSVRDAQALLKEEEPALPGLSRLPEVEGLIAQLYQGHLDGVRYVGTPADLKGRGRGEVGEPALLFDTLLQGAPGDGPPQDPVVLALARGVLYALGQSDGRVRWAMRVGIDTTALPVRVPARVGSLERILVLSSDTATLTALDANGVEQWRYRLGSPSLGRPVVLGQRAYLATYNGDVHEIELIEGKLLGRYELKQRLTRGGTLEPRSSRIYFPADEGCVYVLDVARRRCEMVLYSRHPGGSLRGEPIVVPPVPLQAGEVVPGYLILNQTNGLGAVQLRVFDLPVRDRHAPDHLLDPKAEVEGWTWFTPYHDPEKVVLLSDASVLGMFGLRQARNRDQALFPLLPGGGLGLRPLLHPDGPPPTRVRGRAEVAQVQGDDVWVLAAGRLQRLRLAWGQDVGPRLRAVWKEPIELGSPLHRSQVVEDRAGKSSLVLVTRPPRRSACWASCVGDERGVVHWKRQLGVVCAGTPVSLPAEGGPLLLAFDQGAGLFRIDPALYRNLHNAEWLSAGDAFVADSLDENPGQAPTVLRAADGKGVYVLACPRGGEQLVVRHVGTAEGRKFEVNEATATLSSPLHGTPALVGGHLVLPLGNGVLARLAVPVQARAAAQTGADWRAARAAPDSAGHVTALGGDRFLTTDGGRGLWCWQWPAGGTCNALHAEGAEVDEPALQLKDRVVTAPLLLPGKPDEPVRVCAADSGGVLSLVEVGDNGALAVKRTWDVGGVVTEGPFVARVGGAARVGCVVQPRDGATPSRLVWVDPGRDGVLWAYDTGGEAVVGRPHIAGGLVVVADQSGRYVGVDAATGKPAGKGYRLSGSVAPAASPTAFAPGRLLAPLSDGTMLLLAVEKLRTK